MLPKPGAYAIFAHVFTGNKNLIAAKHISRALNMEGIAVLRFDFTGLGESEGDFADTNFTSNVDDLMAAADFLTENYESPSLIVGHSLGGAASLFAGATIDSIQAIATIGAPAEPVHVTHLLDDKLEEIEKEGKAKINLAGRTFTIKKQFLDDLRSYKLDNAIKGMSKALIVLHSPQDTVVEIYNAAKIYKAAKHPKSFVTLNGADHMLTNKSDAFYTGNVIATWAKRYINFEEAPKLKSDKQVVARLGDTGFTTELQMGRHGMLVDESEDLGGHDFGPSPYQLLTSALAACTSMTLQMYARRKKWPVEEVLCHINYSKEYYEDCISCVDSGAHLDTFNRTIEIKGDLTDEQRARMLEIADKCPVHRSMSNEIIIVTNLKEQ
jgi:putative redox protein